MQSRSIFVTCLILIQTISSSFASTTLESFISSTYSTLQPLEGSKPPYDVFQRAMTGYLNMKADGIEINNEKLTIIDFRLSANKKRMWIIDIATNKVMHHRLVSHGQNSGGEYAEKFSNIKNSNTSSLGFYLTGENYIGKHGLSLRLDGMERGFNDRARERAIVLHGAAYVSNDFITMHGRLGRSFGCPAIALNKHKEIITALANRSVIFIYHPTKEYVLNTQYYNQEKAENYLAAMQIVRT